MAQASGPESAGGEILKTGRPIDATVLSTAFVAQPGAESLPDAVKILHFAPGRKLNKPEADPEARRPIPFLSAIIRNVWAAESASHLRWAKRNLPGHYDRNTCAGGGLRPVLR